MPSAKLLLYREVSHRNLDRLANQGEHVKVRWAGQGTINLGWHQCWKYQLHLDQRFQARQNKSTTEVPRTPAEVPVHCEKELHPTKGVILVYWNQCRISYRAEIRTHQSRPNVWVDGYQPWSWWTRNHHHGSLPSICRSLLGYHQPTGRCGNGCLEWAARLASPGSLTRVGQWSGWVTFPVPASGIWPKHVHLRGILNGYQKKPPNFHKWARPAYEVHYRPWAPFLEKWSSRYFREIKCTAEWKP